MDMRPVAPRSIGDILDDSVKLYRQSFRHWWLPSLVVAIAGFVWGYEFNSSIGWGKTPMSLFNGGNAPAVGFALFVVGFVSLWAYGMLYAALNAAYLGTPLSIGQAAAAGARLLPKLFAIGVVSGLLVLLGCVALIIPGLYIFVRVAIAMQVATTEGRGVFASISRSWELTQGSFWRVSTVLSIAVVIIIVLSIVIVGILTAVVLFMLGNDPVLAGVINLGLQMVQSFLTTAFTPIAGIVLYHDLKSRIDGDDLEHRAEALAAS